jgi:hypothetical protein
MVFCHKLVVLGLTLVLLANSVSGGPGFAALCITACNVAWVACVGGITLYTSGAGFSTAITTCNAVQKVCLAACTFSGALPTP